MGALSIWCLLVKHLARNNSAMKLQLSLLCLVVLIGEIICDHGYGYGGHHDGYGKGHYDSYKPHSYHVSYHVPKSYQHKGYGNGYGHQVHKGYGHDHHKGYDQHKGYDH